MDNLIDLEKKIFRVQPKTKKIFIGNEEIKPEILEILKEQARYIKTSQFYDILHATLINESAKIGWEQENDKAAQFGKALKYVDTILGNMLKGLSK